MRTGTVQVPVHLAGGDHAALSRQGERASRPCRSDPAGRTPGPLDCFPQPAPLVLDLGCGNGLFLSALAAREPALNFLGVERKEYRVRQARRRCGPLENAQVLAGEVSEILRMLPLHSVSRAYLLFSDPWPKRRHAVRRVVQEDFITLLRSRLTPSGGFFFATDCAAYGRWARQMFTVLPGWCVGLWSVAPDWPRTEFEQHFSTVGLPISRFHATPVPPASTLNPQLLHASD